MIESLSRAASSWALATTVEEGSSGSDAKRQEDVCTSDVRLMCLKAGETITMSFVDWTGFSLDKSVANEGANTEQWPRGRVACDEKKA